MSFELTASMMCANYGHLAREVKRRNRFVSYRHNGWKICCEFCHVFE